MKITDSASHSELKIASDGTVRLIRDRWTYGWSCIGSDLVQLSTGIDFVRAVIQVALGETPDLNPVHEKGVASVHYIFGKSDYDVLERLKKEHPEFIVREEISGECQGEITDSGSRYGAFLMRAGSIEDLENYLPWQKEE